MEGAFNRSRLTLHSSEGSAGELLIHVKYPDKPGSIFTLYNTHSLPVAGPDRAREQVLPNRTIRVGNAPFAISYAEIANERWGLGILFERKILNKGALYEVIEPKTPPQEIFKAPFFFRIANISSLSVLK